MVDYVERLDALKELALLDTGEEEYTDNISRTRATIAISNIPAADVVPVVRCKDCKHSEHWYRDKRRCFLWAEDGIDVFDDGFCSYGERKEKET